MHTLSWAIWINQLLNLHFACSSAIPRGRIPIHSLSLRTAIRRCRVHAYICTNPSASSLSPYTRVPSSYIYARAEGREVGLALQKITGESLGIPTANTTLSLPLHSGWRNRYFGFPLGRNSLPHPKFVRLYEREAAPRAHGTHTHTDFRNWWLLSLSQRRLRNRRAAVVRPRQLGLRLLYICV